MVPVTVVTEGKKSQNADGYELSTSTLLKSFNLAYVKPDISVIKNGPLLYLSNLTLQRAKMIKIAKQDHRSIDK